MKHCFFCDVHGNLEALKAVLGAASKENPDRYYCLGDIVGYASDPKGCLGLIRSLEPQAILAGNHEWGVLGLTDPEYFNVYAAKAIRWTRSVLEKSDTDFIKTFKLVYEGSRFTLVHGSLDSPQEFHYIFGADDAGATIKIMNTPVCFVGHSHVAGIFFSDGKTVSELGREKTPVIKGRKYVVNIGSVGQPRDGNPKAAYAIYDDRAEIIDIRRVAYDVKTAQDKIIRAGLPRFLADRLSEGR